MTGSFEHLRDDLVHEGHIISLVTGHFRAPDGVEFARDIVRHPGAVSVVALHDDHTVTMVRQYRAALDVELLEIPAGKRDVADEPPEATAQRELAEEVGLRAGSLVLLAEFVNSAGFTDERSWVFLATDLSTVATDRQGIEEDHLRVERVPLHEVPSMIASARLIDAKSIIGLLLTIDRVGG